MPTPEGEEERERERVKQGEKKVGKVTSLLEN